MFNLNRSSMLKTKAQPSNPTSTSTADTIFASKAEVHAAMVKNPDLTQAKSYWNEDDDRPVMVKRGPDDGIIRGGERLRYFPEAPQGQKRVLCYVQ